MARCHVQSLVGLHAQDRKQRVARSQRAAQWHSERTAGPKAVLLSWLLTEDETSMEGCLSLTRPLRRILIQAFAHDRAVEVVDHCGDAECATEPFVTDSVRSSSYLLDGSVEAPTAYWGSFDSIAIGGAIRALGRS